MNQKPKPIENSSFKRLMSFYGEITKIFDELGLSPIIYGSLAYHFHTGDNLIPIHDIDLLVSEDSFSQIIEILERQDIITHELMPYHSLEVFKEDMKIDIDSIEHFLNPRSAKSEKSIVENIELNFLNKNSLINIYQEALLNMPKIKKLEEKRNSYQKKLNNLKSS